MRRSRSLGLPLHAVALVGSLLSCGENSATSAANQPPASWTVPPSDRATADATAEAPVCAAIDAHSRHVASGIRCNACHPHGARYGFTDAFTYPGGTSTEGGTFTRGENGSPTTCTVACHSPLDAPTHPVSWDASGPLACLSCHAADALPSTHPPVSPTASRADCEVCHTTENHTGGTVVLAPHVAGWMSPGDPSFHPVAANRGLANCQVCHAPDLSGGAAGVSCAGCHDEQGPSGTIAWQTNCTMCHGGADEPSGAPPKTLWGYASDPVRTGAHMAHVVGSAVAPPYDCAVCHVKPTDALTAGHVDEVATNEDPVATVTFSGIAALELSPAWDRATGTCSNTYCHGTTIAGGTLKVPVWTVLDGTQAACGTCHGVPPAAPHPPAPNGLLDCAPCHQPTIDETGEIIPPGAGGKHLNGNIEATGHPLTFMNSADPGFHAFAANRGLDSCQACHGVALDGVNASVRKVACATCHGVAWATTCSMCHGGTDTNLGSPPETTWGNSADLVRVGAHTRHVLGSTTARPIDCAECHAKPTDAFTLGHIGLASTAEVTFGPLAAQGTLPVWNRATGTCASTYCHGGTMLGGTVTTPNWTSGSSQKACGACHGNPPVTGKHWHVADDFATCGDCHGAAYNSGTKIDLAVHANGVKNLGPVITRWDGKYCYNACHGNTRKTWY
jgi:predicted CxxxxCH...CXXCH cytochrome family protein